MVDKTTFVHIKKSPTDEMRDVENFTTRTTPYLGPLSAPRSGTEDLPIGPTSRPTGRGTFRIHPDHRHLRKGRGVRGSPSLRDFGNQTLDVTRCTVSSVGLPWQ